MSTVVDRGGKGGELRPCLREGVAAINLDLFRFNIVKKLTAIFCILSMAQWSCGQNQNNVKLDDDRLETTEKSEITVMKSDEEWQKELTAEQYRVLREKGTERPFTGEYYKHKEEGTYVCAGCGAELFDSDTKYDSGCGWPSFYAGMEGKITTKQDNSLGMARTEIMCAKCGGHLGHIFNDGPQPTGQRYCVNSASLDFTSDGVIKKTDEK